MIYHYLDLDNLTKEDCVETFELLKKELIVVIKKANPDHVGFSKLVSGMSSIANWGQLVWDTSGNYIGNGGRRPDPWTESIGVQRVTAEKSKSGEGYSGIFPKGRLEWHANLNGPDRADGVALQGYAGVEGTVTSWLDTKLAYEVMPKSLRDKIKGKYCTYYYNMENWADIDNKNQLKFMQKHQEAYRMWIEQENIVGVKGLYFYTNNDLKISNGDIELYQEIKDFIFQEKFMYHHDWEVGDIVLSDQLLTLHRRPLRPDSVFEKRILHRLTFPISNTGEPKFIVERNKDVPNDNLA